jgi:CHASE2 domain-containing sensor protein
MSIDDIVDREFPRIEKLIENQKSGALVGLSRSTPALLVIALLVFLFQIRNLPEKLATQSLDSSIAVQQKSPAQSVQMVVIDDADYLELFSGSSPLNPLVFSQLLMAIAAAQPRAIIVDIDTSAPSFAAMEVPSVPTVWAMDGEELENRKFAALRPLGGRSLPRGAVAALALVPQDDREIVRGYRRTYELEGDGVVESPGYAIARLLTSAPPLKSVMSNGNERFLDFRYRFITSKASSVLSDSKSEVWKDISIFKGKVVLIGGTYRAARDRHATPAGLLNGSQVVAQEAESEINGTSIPSASRWLTGLLMVLGGLATVAIYRWSSLRLSFLISLLFIPLLSVISNWILFHRFAAWGAMVPLVSAVIVVELYTKANVYLDFYKKIVALQSRERSGPEVTEHAEDSLYAPAESQSLPSSKDAP